MSLDRVHRGREPLPAGAAGDGVAVGVGVFRFVLGREAPRERGVVLFLPPCRGRGAAFPARRAVGGGGGGR